MSRYCMYVRWYNIWKEGMSLYGVNCQHTLIHCLPPSHRSINSL